jgi:hypothetical protein
MIVLQNVDVDVNEVWGNMVGGHSGYWADEFRTLKNGRVDFYKDEHYAEPNPQDMEVLADGEWHLVTVRSLAEAYVKLKQDGWRHCSHYDIDEEDACTGDALLQMAAFGEFVYG